MEEYISKKRGFGTDKEVVENNRVCKQRTCSDKGN